MSYPCNDDFFKVIVQNSTDLISIIDDQRVFKFASPSLKTILGYRPDQLIGKSVLDYIHPEDVLTVEQAFVTPGRSLQVKLTPVRFLSRSEGWKWLETTGTNMLDNAAVRGILVNSKDVTARVLAEQSEKQRQAYFSSLFHNTPVGVFAIDLEGHIQTTNASVEKLFKLNGKEILGSGVASLFADAEPVITAIDSIRLGKASSFENRLVLKDGHETHVNMRVIPVHQDEVILGGHIVMEDITGKKNDLKQLEMLSLVASKTTNGVIITDAEDRVEWVNAAFTRVTGYHLSKIRGQVPASFLQGPDTSRSTALRIENNRQAKVSFAEEILNYTIAGEGIWFLIEVTPLLDQEGNLVRTITIQTDITEKKKIEEELHKLTSDLSRQNQDLQQFTYMVSHNLRSPIANAKGLLDLLTVIDKADPFFDDSLQMLQSSVQHLEQITADMNSILTFRDKNKSESAESINLRAFLKESVKDFQDFRSCSLTQINNRVSGDICIKANRGFLHNIFTNLISNSMKYRSEERSLQIDLDAWYSNGMVYITLEDNGIGFDSDKLKNQLFKLYKRFHTNKEEGRGIGLYLVKTAVEAMNGKISVESTPGSGTKFMISIPTC